MLRIVIPGEMRGKGRPRFSTAGGFARAFTDSKTANMEAWVKSCAVQAGATMLDGPLALRMEITCAIPASWPKSRKAMALTGGVRPTGKPDLDNTMKLACDALNGIAWGDDKQVVEAVVSKRYGAEPQTIIEVRRA